MPHKNKEDRKRWLKEREARMSPEEREARRAYFRAKAKAYYWRHPERMRAKSRANTRSGLTAKQQAARRERLAKSYVKRCLIQRGWSKEEISTWLSTPELYETVRIQIQTKREIRKWRSTTSATSDASSARPSST